MKNNIPSVEALESAHEFPATYMIKAFGPHEQAFVDAVDLAARRIVTDVATLVVEQRLSSAGNHVCVSVSATFSSAEHTQALYRELLDVPGMRLLL